jgi:phosphogluconate dehydratase
VLSAPRIGELVDERTIVNAMVALLATGGSTNHLIHWVAVARAAGILIDWTDFSDLSAEIPLLARIYPNGKADVNQFQSAGGPAFVIRELLRSGCMHGDVATVTGSDLWAYTRVPSGTSSITWNELPADSTDDSVLRPATDPFSDTGGLRLLTGNLGRAVVKISAVPEHARVVEAPAIVFDSQESLLDAFKSGKLERDFVAVVRYQGPRANGMPELHKLMPPMGVLQGKGYKVAIATDGRMSGASGEVLSAIHVSPETLAGGALGRVRDGDLIRIDAVQGVLEAVVPPQEWALREPCTFPPELAESNSHGLGRDLFGSFRRSVLSAEEGAITWL